VLIDSWGYYAVINYATMDIYNNFRCNNLKTVCNNDAINIKLITMCILIILSHEIM